MKYIEYDQNSYDRGGCVPMSILTNVSNTLNYKFEHDEILDFFDFLTARRVFRPSTENRIGGSSLIKVLPQAKLWLEEKGIRIASDKVIKPFGNLFYRYAYEQGMMFITSRKTGTEFYRDVLADGKLDSTDHKYDGKHAVNVFYRNGSYWEINTHVDTFPKNKNIYKVPYQESVSLTQSVSEKCRFLYDPKVYFLLAEWIKPEEVKIKKKLTTRNTSGKKNTKEYIVLHHTGTGEGTIKGVLNTLTISAGNGAVSCHYVVDTNGDIYQINTENDILWHCGTSSRDGKVMMNRYSIGIEIIGPLGDGGFTREQKISVRRLVQDIRERNGIPKSNIITHQMIAPDRKWDVSDTFWNDEFKTWKDYQMSY